MVPGVVDAAGLTFQRPGAGKRELAVEAGGSCAVVGLICGDE